MVYNKKGGVVSPSMMSQQPLGIRLTNFLEVGTLHNWCDLIERLTVFKQQLSHRAVPTGVARLELIARMAETQVTMLAFQVLSDPDKSTMMNVTSILHFAPPFLGLYLLVNSSLFLLTIIKALHNWFG